MTGGRGFGLLCYDTLFPICRGGWMLPPPSCICFIWSQSLYTNSGHCLMAEFARGQRTQTVYRWTKQSKCSNAFQLMLFVKKQKNISSSYHVLQHAQYTTSQILAQCCSLFDTSWLNCNQILDLKTEGRNTTFTSEEEHFSE